MIIITFRWPHEGVMLGFELFPPEEKFNYWTFRLHLFILTISYEWDDNNDYI
jgi:hypothetical protein